MKHLFSTSMAALGLVTFSPVARAVSLDVLIAGNGSIVIGDKLFAGFGLTGYNASSIDVTASITAGVYYLRFDGPLLNSGGTPGNPNDPAALQLSYTIETTSGLPLITEIDQSFGLFAEGTGGEVQILEIVRAGSFGGAEVGRSALGFTLAGVLDPSDPAAEVGDVLLLGSPQAKLFVSTSIFLNALPNGTVGAMFVTSSFHQTTFPGGGVPDAGSSLILLGAVLSGISLVRRCFIS